MPAPSGPEPQASGQFTTALPGPVIPHAGRAGPTPRLSMQVSLLMGHSQPGPSQPLSHTHAPLEQRPRSATPRGDITQGPVPSRSPALSAPVPLSLRCKGAANRLHSILPARLQAQSPHSPSPVTQPPRASATSPGVPCLCHQDGARHSTSHSWGMLGAAGLPSPLQRKPEVRGHCRTSYWQNVPSKRCVRSSE